MIEAGKTFCPYCVRVHDKAYYSNNDISWGVWLNRNRISGKYDVTAEDFQKNTAPKGKLELVPFNQDDDTLPEMIQVQLPTGSSKQNDQGEIMLYRHCPVCAKKGEHREVNYILGKYPTFVIAMIGDRSAGKSAWLDAIATAGNTRAVNERDYPHRLRYTTMAPRAKRPASTKWESRGSSKVLSIRDRQDNERVVAVVYLVDVAGELYDRNQNTKQTEEEKKKLIWNLLNRNHDYPGADAYVFMESAVNKHGNSDGYSADQIYIDLNEHELLKGKPLAYVMTHLDKLIEEGVFKDVRAKGDGNKYPVMTRDTFNLNVPTSYERKDLLPRVAVEHAIVRAYNPTALDHTDGPMKCFLVRSCEVRMESVLQKDGNVKGELMEDLTVNNNVMDPLIWILNQLKLFPLRERVK